MWLIWEVLEVSSSLGVYLDQEKAFDCVRQNQIDRIQMMHSDIERVLMVHGSLCFPVRVHNDPIYNRSIIYKYSQSLPAAEAPLNTLGCIKECMAALPNVI